MFNRLRPSRPRTPSKSNSALVAYRIYCFLIAFSILGTAAADRLRVEPGFVPQLSGVCLILSGAFVVIDEFGSWTASCFIALVSAAAEILGITTGFPFGRYQYTEAWWPTVRLGRHPFPLLLPVAWVLVAAGAWIFVRYRFSGWRAIVAAAFVAMAIDWPMEQAMVSVFHYWHWENGSIPLSNAVGWFGTAFIALAPLGKHDVVPNGRAPRVLGLFCLFLAISGALRFWNLAWVLLASYAFILCLAPSVMQNADS